MNGRESNGVGVKNGQGVDVPGLDAAFRGGRRAYVGYFGRELVVSIERCGD